MRIMVTRLWRARPSAWEALACGLGAGTTAHSMAADPPPAVVHEHPVLWALMWGCFVCVMFYVWMCIGYAVPPAVQWMLRRRSRIDAEEEVA